MGPAYRKGVPIIGGPVSKNSLQVVGRLGPNKALLRENPWVFIAPLIRPY